MVIKQISTLEVTPSTVAVSLWPPARKEPSMLRDAPLVIVTGIFTGRKSIRRLFVSTLRLMFDFHFYFLWFNLFFCSVNSIYRLIFKGEVIYLYMIIDLYINSSHTADQYVFLKILYIYSSVCDENNIYIYIFFFSFITTIRVQRRILVRIREGRVASI